MSSVGHILNQHCNVPIEIWLRHQGHEFLQRGRAIGMRREHHGGARAIGQLEDAELLVEKRRWLRRRRGLFGFVGCGGCFMRGLGGRGGRIETQRRARNVFHRGLHLGFVIGIGPDVIPYVLGPVGPIGDGDFLMHVGRQA